MSQTQAQREANRRYRAKPEFRELNRKKHAQWAKKNPAAFARVQRRGKAKQYGFTLKSCGKCVARLFV